MPELRVLGIGPVSLNTMVYEAGGVALRDSLPRMRDFGFTYVDLNAWRSGDPDGMSSRGRRELRESLRGLGLVVSQMLMIKTRDMASSERRSAPRPWTI